MRKNARASIRYRYVQISALAAVSQILYRNKRVRGSSIKKGHPRSQIIFESPHDVRGLINDINTRCSNRRRHRFIWGIFWHAFNLKV